MEAVEVVTVSTPSVRELGLALSDDVITMEADDAGVDVKTE